MLNNKKIIFWGTPEFATPSLRILLALGLVKAVVTQPDRPAGRNKKLTPSPIKKIAELHSLPVLTPEKLNEELIAEFKKYLPATFVIVAYGKIIPQNILDLSERPAINIHPSALPILRGPSPIQFALLNDFKETAVTLMQLDSQMDHGPILAQQILAIEHKDNYETLSNKLAILAGKILAGVIITYLDGGLTAREQDDSQATYCSLLKKENGEVSWRDSAKKIHNMVRAFNPWPGVYTEINGLPVKFIQTALADKELRPAEFKAEQNRLFVGTDDGSLEILQIQPEGKRVLTTAEFLRGYGKYL